MSILKSEVKFQVKHPKGCNFMTIQVELIDGTFCRVVPKGLNLLLSREMVKRFRRSSGWAVVGKDPIRYNNKQCDYNGPERRQAI